MNAQASAAPDISRWTTECLLRGFGAHPA